MIGKFINKAGEEFEVFIDDGTDKEITLVPDAVIINYNGDDIFKPLKCSGATIKCYVDEYMFDLYSGQYDTKVVINSNNYIWVGYITPNIYS